MKWVRSGIIVGGKRRGKGVEFNRRRQRQGVHRGSSEDGGVRSGDNNQRKGFYSVK